MNSSKTIILLCCVACLSLTGLAQHVDLGYHFQVGMRDNFDIGDAYSQSIHTKIHTGLVRFYNEDQHHATTISFGARKDSIGFANNSFFLTDDNLTLTSFNANGHLTRKAWRTGVAHEVLLGRKPYKRHLGFNGGVFYEGTLQMRREGGNNDRILVNEVNRNNLGFHVGAQLKLGVFVLGYRYEKLLFDMLDHEYINSLTPSSDNSSELRGLNLSPELSTFYFGINIGI